MKNISEIKLSGNVYNIKDAYARNGNYSYIAKFWDGNIENLDVIPAKENLSYYRVSDSIEMTNDQFLLGNSHTLNMYLLQGSSAPNLENLLNSEVAIMVMLPDLLGVTLGPANIISSSCNVQENTSFGQICISLFGSSASEEVEQELRNLAESGIQLGVNMSSRTITYINAPHDFTFDYLASFFFGSDEPINFPAGLWMAKLMDSIYVDTMYLVTPEFSKIIDYGLKIVFEFLQSSDLMTSTLIE